MKTCKTINHFIHKDLCTYRLYRSLCQREHAGLTEKVEIVVGKKRVGDNAVARQWRQHRRTPLANQPSLTLTGSSVDDYFL